MIPLGRPAFRFFLSIFCALLTWASPSLVSACSVPVFRYALERWRPDPYGVIVFHYGPLTQEEQTIAQQFSQDGLAGKLKANVQVLKVDLADNPSPDWMELYRETGGEQAELDALAANPPATMPTQPGASLTSPRPEPFVAVLFPRRSFTSQGFVYTGPLTAKLPGQLLESPVRKNIAKQLVDGQTAVWVLLESGDKKQDDAAAKLLSQELAEMPQVLKLPEIKQADIDQGLLKADPNSLKLAFSLVRLSRKDAEERFLVEMFLGSEAGLRELESPMAFPVFGRGRSYYALAGSGISKRLIRETCNELVGPCTCQIKEQNPGIDLLFSKDWDQFIELAEPAERPLPLLPGLGSVAVEEDDPQATDQVTAIAPLDDVVVEDVTDGYEVQTGGGLPAKGPSPANATVSSESESTPQVAEASSSGEVATVSEAQAEPMQQSQSGDNRGSDPVDQAVAGALKTDSGNLLMRNTLIFTFLGITGLVIASAVILTRRA